MVVVQACKLNLPQIPSLSSSDVSSLLFDPDTLSLALMHSDSSFSLYPSLSSPFSLTSQSLPPPKAIVPGPNSSATFLRLQTSKNPNSKLLFAVASPLRSGAAVLLRFYILSKDPQSFLKTRVDCNQSGLKFDHGKSGVVFNVNHGVSIKLAGSINVFAMHSVSNCKIWVFAVKLVDDNEGDGVTVKLMKCAVIDCCKPVFAITVSFGFLILGEENGVRVFPLRPLVKGRVKKHGGREGKNSKNGLSNDKAKGTRMNGSERRAGGDKAVAVEASSNGHVGGKMEKHGDSVKLKSVKLRQISREESACFVPLKKKEVCESTEIPLQLAKAISIQALSQNEFLILDSAGDLHLMSLRSPFTLSEAQCHVKLLTNTMNVNKLAVLTDARTRAQTVWTSDGCHTVHALAIPEPDDSVRESDGLESDDKLKQNSVLQAIFASERIQEIVPLAASSILFLGQGSLFAYAIS